MSKTVKHKEPKAKSESKAEHKPTKAELDKQLADTKAHNESLAARPTPTDGPTEADKKKMEAEAEKQSKALEAEQVKAGSEIKKLKKDGVLRMVCKVDQVVADKPPSSFTNIIMSPMVQGSFENKDFFKGPPNGSITFAVNSHEVRDFFQNGVEINVDFCKREKEGDK